ncbi:hypothetical protein F4778DRAFT_421590 [Xylariomycetidae sp. FL2044]|nr:hypothetical protein F4778DRAFT_421590 [Xylariomycetidae sp. FL2044]
MLIDHVFPPRRSAHEVPTGRTTRFRPMSDTTKSGIKWARRCQLVLRSLELVGGLGLLVLMILISNVDPLTAWVMRITVSTYFTLCLLLTPPPPSFPLTSKQASVANQRAIQPGVISLCCVYAIYHLSRPARARPPASSAAYQLFAGFTDLAAMPLYAFGVISIVNRSEGLWGTILADETLARPLVQAEYYALIGAGGLHLVSLCISLWLGLVFRRIANMPPDMNPLEDHLTSRAAAQQHKRNRSSVYTTTTTASEHSSKRLSTPLEDYRRSGAPHEEDLSRRPPSIPFMHTRTQSRDSFASSSSSSHKRDSRGSHAGDLPSRQYQIRPYNSPRNSLAGSAADLKRLSTPRLAQRGSYTEIPLHETGVSPSPSSPLSLRPSSINTANAAAAATAGGSGGPINASPTRVAKFTEAWYASESLIQRTQQRQRAMRAAERPQQQQQQQQQQYEAVGPPPRYYDLDGGDLSEGGDSDRENGMLRPGVFSDLEDEYNDDDDEDEDDDDEAHTSPINASGRMHPNPLRSNPTPPTPPPPPPPRKNYVPPRQKTPFSRIRDSTATAATTTLSEISLNPRSASGSRDIADEKPGRSKATNTTSSSSTTTTTMMGWGAAALLGGRRKSVRNSSIQPEADFFYSKPYGELKPATPPIMIGGERQVSSGNDYYYGLGGGGGGGGGGNNVGGAGVGGVGGGGFGRRNVSGKVAEEGMAGPRSRYSILNE